MAKNKKRPAKKTPAKKKAKAKAKSKVKKVVKKSASKKAAKKATKKIAKKRAAKKTAKKRVAAAPKAAQKKSAASTLDKKSVKPFAGEDTQKSLLPQSMGSPMLKDSDLDEELGEDEVDIAVEADEDVEEELTLDGEDEDAGFPEKPEGLLDDADEYHTH